MKRTFGLILAAITLAGCASTASAPPQAEAGSPSAFGVDTSGIGPTASVATDTPAAEPSAIASPSAQPPSRVEFIVTGSAPYGIDITYGPSGSNFAGPPVLHGKAVMSVKFDPSASYYALNAQLQGAGSIRCKIVVTGPGDEPLTVSHGAASGGYNICSAQAAPATPDGTSWQDEN